MQITHAISLDFQRYKTPPQINVVQDDAYSRYVAATLFNNASEWAVPDGVTVAVRYRKPDKTQGAYDTLPDGTTAYVIRGNTVTVGVAPQMLTVKGKVTASVVMFLGSVQLATFPFVLNVVENPAAGQSISNDYYYLQTWDDVNAAIGNLSDLQTADQSSLVAAINEVRATLGGSSSGGSVLIDATLTKKGYAADAKATGEAISKVSGQNPYELPIGGDELGGVKNGGNVTINADGTMTAPESEVTDEQVETSVSNWLDDHPEATTTVQDGAITTEKLADNAVTTDKIDGVDVINPVVPWKLFYDGMNTKAGELYPDENSAIYVVHLEKGKTYFGWGSPYPAPVNAMPNPSYADNAYHGYYAAYSAPLTREAIAAANRYPSTNMVAVGVEIAAVKGMYSAGYIETTSATSLDSTLSGNYFTVLSDVWIYRAALKPTDGMRLRSIAFVETEPGYTGTSNDMRDVGYEWMAVFKFDLGGNTAVDQIGPGTANMAMRTKSTVDRVYAAMSRDVPRDRSLRIMFIGDSITYAGSNAGLQHAFRKYVSMNLNAPCYTICQSGASVTTGSGSFDWNGQAGDSFDAAVSGYAGLVTKMPRPDTGVNDKFRMEETDVVVVELGTNDFWEGAPLGSVSDLTDDTTFYGAVEKTITLLEATFPNAQILWVLPFKNSKWTTANTAGHTLVDYLIALKILCQTHERVWVLDLFDKWYLDYDNESIRSKFFIDAVHITGNAHKCVAEAMIDKIRQIVAVCGLKRIEQPAWYASTDSRYGAT